MRLVHVVPRAFAFPELRSYGCRACNEAVTIEVEQPRAMSSKHHARKIDISFDGASDEM
jgi:hypothetical protein